MPRFSLEPRNTAYHNVSHRETEKETAMDMIGKARVTRANDTSIAWGELGQGEPLILLHGLGDSHRTWRRVAPQLSSRFRLLMPDLPGHGLSGRPDAPYTLEWYAETMARWMDDIGVS